ncbi:hypothetical protein [uncultured Microscilla sp.]|uniref:hypothetical protein n=1 Tax=uncultured Microscilla sp. TaxID=432653 RepID=UPI00262F86A3|nr:hypothetical protein [uncultured Microscilla sp.]
MSDSRAIIIDGDLAVFELTFGKALTMMMPVGTMKGSGDATFGSNKLCVLGDEKDLKVENVPYNSPPFVGGQGTVKIEKLESDQVAGHTNSGGKKVILKGKKFKAKLEVSSPAKDPNGVSDPNAVYVGGMGEFKTTNKKFTGT